MGLEEGCDEGRSVGLALPSLAPNTCGVLLAESVPGTSWFAHIPRCFASFWLSGFYKSALQPGHCQTLLVSE